MNSRPLQAGQVVDLKAPSRVHLGLVAWGVDPAFEVGGAGVMILDPAVHLRVNMSQRVEVVTPPGSSFDHARISATVQRVLVGVRAHLIATQRPVPSNEGVRLEFVSLPEAHVGLGSGTAVAIAVARGIAEAHGLSGIPTETLADWTGRGVRSGIGLHGAARGGFLVDGGRRNVDSPAPLVAAATMPPEWRVVLATPGHGPGVNGADEVAAFRTLAPPGDSERSHARTLIIDRMTPAVKRADFLDFADAVDSLQNLVADLFRPVQSDRYARPNSATVVDHMREAGLSGVGQSSWGPTLFGFVPDPPRAEVAACQLRALGFDARVATPSAKGTRCLVAAT